MRTTFYIIRHRESEKNLLEIHHSRGTEKYPLTEKGKKQADDLVDLFRRKAIDVIYTSPFLRCRDTIDPLAQDRGLIPIIDDRITELDVGDLDETLWKFSWTPDRILTDLPLGGVGESLVHCRWRIFDFLDEMKQKHRGQSVVVCTHGEPGLFAKQYFLGFDYDNPTERDSQYPAKDGYDECIVDVTGKLISTKSYGISNI